MLVNTEFFKLFGDTVCSEDESMKLATISILNCVLNHDPSLVRTYCLSQASDSVQSQPIVELLISRFLTEDDQGIISQNADTIMRILDTTGLGLDVHLFI